jgi:chromosome segregation ATPase
MIFSSYERQLAELTTTLYTIRSFLRTVETHISELEKDRRYLAERGEDEKTGREADKRKWEAERGSLNAEVAEIRRRVSELEVALADLQDEYSILQRGTSPSSSQHASQLSALKSDLAFSRSELAASSQHAHAQAETIARPEAEMDEKVHLLDTLKSISRDLVSTDVLRAELARISTHVRALEGARIRLEAENEKLRVKAVTVGVLEEKVRAATEWAEDGERVKEENVRLRAALEGLRAERLHAPTSIDAASGIGEFTKLRHENIALLDNVSMLRSPVRKRPLTRRSGRRMSCASRA